MIGIGKAAQMGVLVRNAQSLQQASNIDWVVLDKTGTITQGHPSVEDFAVFNNAAPMHTLELAQAIEQASAKSIVTYCKSVLLDASASLAPKMESFVSLSGLGVEGEIEMEGMKNVKFIMGNVKLMHTKNLDLGAAKEWLAIQQSKGRSLVLVAHQGALMGGFGLEDAVQPDSADAIKRLKSQGIKVVMLTGDNQAKAMRVASLVGVDDYAAQLMPQDKLNHIKHLQEQGNVVAMVGDGINDAPALSQANVSFAMGQGTDVAIESADLCLLSSSLLGVADAIELSHATLRNIKQNLWGAFTYNSLGIPIAAGVLFPFTGALLSPMLAALAMSLSSVTVVTNANRLRFFKPTLRK